MLSWFRRKPSPESATFNERARAFWSWYSEAASRFYATIEAKKCADLTDEINSKIKEWLPGFAWVFGPGAGGKGHSLTFTGEGNIHRQLLALQWLEFAPKLEGWTFYAARQPGAVDGIVIEMMDLKFDANALWIAPQVNVEAEKIDITIWHPAWEKLEQNQRATVVFLFLDEVLGEYGTDRWIGKLEFGAEKLAASFPLKELGEFVRDLQAKHNWTEGRPGDNYTLFTMKNPGSGRFPRSDLLTQITAVPALFSRYMESEGEFDDPLTSFGADYAYLSIDSDFFPDGRQSEARGEIEERVDQVLRGEKLGRCIGGAYGRQRTYVDLLLFDGPRSLEKVRQLSKQLALPKGTMIEFFARNKRGQRVAI